MIFPLPSSPHWAPNTLSEVILGERWLEVFLAKSPRESRSESRGPIVLFGGCSSKHRPKFSAQLELPKPPPPGVSTSMTAPAPKLREA